MFNEDSSYFRPLMPTIPLGGLSFYVRTLLRGFPGSSRARDREVSKVGTSEGFALGSVGNPRE